EQDGGAFAQRLLRPVLERRRCRGDGLVELPRTRRVDLPADLTGGRVAHLDRLAGAVSEPAADEVLDGGRGHGPPDGSVRGCPSVRHWCRAVAAGAPIVPPGHTHAQPLSGQMSPSGPTC